MVDSVALLSGGLDSSTLAYHLVKGQNKTVHFLSFYYGQRHARELQAARFIAQDLEQKHDIIYIDNETHDFLRGPGATSLTNPEVEVPDGHYAEETMKATIVPNRNAIMLSVAFGVAISDQAPEVAFGAHAGDHYIYPDCRPEFILAFQHAMLLGNDNKVLLYSPFEASTKADIVRLGFDLSVPLHKTWSCYKGRLRHCGTCGTCTERIEAFRLAKVPDPTTYEEVHTA